MKEHLRFSDEYYEIEREYALSLFKILDPISHHILIHILLNTTKDPEHKGVEMHERRIASECFSTNYNSAINQIKKAMSTLSSKGFISYKCENGVYKIEIL